MSNWDQLLCPYFADVAIRVLGNFFYKCGFLVKKTKIGGVIFQRNSIFIEVSYVPERYPNYSPTLIIGNINDKFAGDGGITGIPLWHILPVDSEVRSYSFWSFTSDQELESVLNLILNQILSQYLEPLWNDHVLFKSYIEEFKSGLQ